MTRAFRAFIVVAVAVCVVSVGVICVRGFLLLSAGCPGDDVDRQRAGLAVVRAALPPGTLREETLSDCDSGDRPFFTVYARGAGDPVRQLMAADGEWSPASSEPGTGESAVSRPLEGATLSVTAWAYTAEDQVRQPEPGVRWGLSIRVD
jgi:hypothetical protein